MRIAIVEDEPRIREGIHKLLARTNDSFIVVGEAENGREGVRLILRERPDVVIADVRMPEMDGIEMIAAVQEKGQNPVVIVLSAYSDFAYAQRAMKLGVREYLVKPVVVDELIGAVRRAQEIVQRQNQTRHGLRTRTEMLAGALYADEAFSDQAREYARENLELSPQTSFALLLLRPISSLERFDAAKAQKLTGESCVTLAPTAQGDVPFVWVNHEQPDELLYIIERKLLPQWREQGCFVAIMGNCTGLDNLHPLYQSLLEYIAYGLIGANGRLLRYPQLTERPLELFSYPIELENAARQSLARHDGQAVAARIMDFSRLFQTGIPHSPRDIKEAYVRFTWALLSTARELGTARVESLSRQALLEKIMSAVHPMQLETLCRELIQLLAREEPARRKTGPLVRRAEALMKAHFSQGITLDEIAQKLSVTPEYLGTQIHRELGVTFGTLMKKLRVEKAKELFLSTDKKLYEIAEMVGYSDAKYFSRVFQSITNMTPAEYRRLNK